MSALDSVSPHIQPASRVKFLLLWLLLVIAAQSAAAIGLEGLLPQVQAMLPGAESLHQVPKEPPYAQILAGGEVLGYALLTDQVHPIPAYSGRPISTLIVFDTEGQVRGVSIVSHQEPILAVGISDQELAHYTGQYVGIRPEDEVRIGGPPRPGYRIIDGLSGATITAMVLNSGIVQSLREVAGRHGLVQQGPKTATASSPEPIWIGMWRERWVSIAVLLAGFAVLLGVLVFQDQLVRRPRLFEWIRIGFLLFTLSYIGWYTRVQLSIVNVLTFIRALFTGFQWEGFLIDPFIFLMWVFAAFTLLLWGRGVYCGWLCPFGALQELLFRLARRLGLPTWEPSSPIHERLVALRYLVLFGLFGLFLYSFPMAERVAELEPFKTAIVLRFLRGWPFVVYALGLLTIGLFVRKCYCRYLCPLGAALTFPSRFHVLDWLRRRKECGHPCQTCARECEMQGIRPTGEINDLECHYCLDCQATYWDDHKCPPMVEQRRKRERRVHIKLALEQERHPPKGRERNAVEPEASGPFQSLRLPRKESV